MPRQKKPQALKIFEGVTGIKMDPLAEKIANHLIRAYRRNRYDGYRPVPAAKKAADDFMVAIGAKVRVGRSYRKAPEPKEESDLEVIARLKRELDASTNG